LRVKCEDEVAFGKIVVEGEAWVEEEFLGADSGALENVAFLRFRRRVG